MFEPVCVECGGSYHGHGAFRQIVGPTGAKLRKSAQVEADESPDDHDHFAVLVWPGCHLCGRVLTEEDHTDEAGSDGDIFWCSYTHSPDGLEEIAGVLAFFEYEEVRVRAESRSRLQQMINDAVRDALAERGLA